MEGKPTQVFSAFGEAAPTVAPRHGASAHEARGVLSRFQARYESRMEEEYTLQEYLELCKSNPAAYATAPERMLMAIGEPEMIDTRNDPRLSRIFSNKTLKVYPAFRDFYGMEETIEQIVAYFKHAAQALEERKQILYLLGPPGGGKSSLAEELKHLMEQMPFYALKGSPVNESPLGLFTQDDDGAMLEDEYGIPRRYLIQIPSPWAVKRLAEHGGDLTKFRVVKLHPSTLAQIAICKTEPGDENNQDISSLTGKLDIRKLEQYSQDDPDAYSYSGGLCRANQGLLEFVEMFKAPIKVLHPLLTATQEGNYKGTEGFGAIPFDGIVLAHSNEAEWQSFKNNKNNEAFIDRVYIVKVPYCLRVTEEIRIYDKLVANSSLAHAPCAPETLKMLAQFAILTRLKEPENSCDLLQDAGLRRRESEGHRPEGEVDAGVSRLRRRGRRHDRAFHPVRVQGAVEGVQLRSHRDRRQPGAPSLRARAADRARAVPGRDREALSLGGQGVPLGAVRRVHRQGDPDGLSRVLLRVRPEHLRPLRHVRRPLDPGPGVPRSEHRRDPRPRGAERRAGEDREAGGHLQPEGFPATRSSTSCSARAPRTTARTRRGRATRSCATVIEKKMFSTTEDLLPVISFNAKASEDEQKKHQDFVDRMVAKGYTPKQVRLLVEWYLRVRKSS